MKSPSRIKPARVSRQRRMQVEALEPRYALDASYRGLVNGDLEQPWTSKSEISINHNWSLVSNIVGYNGAGLTSGTGTDPQLLVAEGGAQHVSANHTSLTTSTSVVIAEYENFGTIGVRPHTSGNAPYFVFHVSTLNANNVRVQYSLRDLDTRTNTAAQPFALQYRLGETGDFVNVAAGFVADATDTGGTATMVTTVDVILPAEVNNQPQLQVRIITADAANTDEWVGIDDIRISANKWPRVTLPDEPPTFIEDQAAVVIQPLGVILDYDLSDYDTGTLTVTNTNAAVGDRIEVLPSGTGVGQVSVSGNTLLYEGNAVGTFQGGEDGAPLVCTFNSASTRAAVVAVLNRLTFRHEGDHPSTHDRTISVVVTDGDGGTSAPATATVRVVAVDDAPTITLTSPAPDYSSGGAAVFLDTAASFTDRDDTLVSQATLSVQLAQPQPGDLLGIHSEGNAAGQIAVAGNSLRYGGVEVATINTSVGLIVTFNAQATRAAIEQLLRSITFRNTLASPTVGSRTIQFTFTETDTTSASASAGVNVRQTLPDVTIADASFHEGNAGTKSLLFTVSLSAAPTSDVVVQYTTQDGTATTAGSDYLAWPGTLTFTPTGPLTQTIAVLVLGDITYEGDEQFTVKLTSATNARLADDEAVGTLSEDDPVPSLTVGGLSVWEGDSGTAVLRYVVRLSNPSFLPITVNYATADGTATSASGDYQAVAGSVIFSPGEIQKTVEVSAFGDQAIEVFETVLLQVTSTGNTSNVDAQASATIMNDDMFAPLVVSAAAPLGNGMNNGSPDSFRLQRSGANLELYIDGALARSLPLANVQEVVIEGSSDADTLVVDYSTGYWSVPDGVTFDGNLHGIDTGENDQLTIVADDDADDLVIHRLAQETGGGAVVVGPASGDVVTTYSDVETVQLLDEALSPLADHRLVVLPWDIYEPNNSLATATVLTVGATYAAQVDGDVDWYQVTAQATGTLDFTVLFTQSGGSQLALEIYDRAGGMVLDPAFYASGADFARSRIPVVQGEPYYVRVRGANAGAANSYSVTVAGSPAPVPAAPSNPRAAITDDNTPTLSISLADDALLADPGRTVGPAIAIPFQTSVNTAGFRIAVFANEQLLGFAGLTATANVYTFTPAALPDGTYQFTARVQILDVAGEAQTGFGAASNPLELTIDTVLPHFFFGDSTTGDDGLHADSDTGIDGIPETFRDRITRDTTPTFFGTTEPGAWVTVVVDTNRNGIIDGSDEDIVDITVDEDGSWEATVTSDLANGQWNLIAAVFDRAGNTYFSTELLGFVIDTQPPGVDTILVLELPTYDLLAAPRMVRSPSPVTSSLALRISDLPHRAGEFWMQPFEDAQASTAQYSVVGASTGIVAIDAITFQHSPDVTRDIVLHFAQPLADDDYTLTVSGLVDLAGNPLVPTTLVFTIDSRPEVGVWAGATATIDTNGNGQLDPVSAEGDVVYAVDQASNALFVGNFSLFADDQADGFDKLATYAEVDGKWRFFVDVDSDGVPDNEPGIFPALGAVTELSIAGIPVAGRFDDVDANGDEVGLFDGTRWYFDTNHNLVLDDGDLVLASALRGQPIVGDFDGDGFDDLATLDGSAAHFDLTSGTRRGWDGVVDATVLVANHAPGQHAVAADMDADGVDDVGLWLPEESDGVWVFILSRGGAIVDVDLPVDDAGHRVVIDATSGQAAFVFDEERDLQLTFGSAPGLPLVGNFARPWVAQPGVPVGTYTNPENPHDVDGDGAITPSDALALINYLNSFGSGALTSTSRRADGPYYDVSGDRVLAPQDALMVINYLNTFGAGESRGESLTTAAPASVDHAARAAAQLPLSLWFNYFEQDATSDDEDELLGLLAAAAS